MIIGYMRLQDVWLSVHVRWNLDDMALILDLVLSESMISAVLSGILGPINTVRLRCLIVTGHSPVK